MLWDWRSPFHPNWKDFSEIEAIVFGRVAETPEASRLSCAPDRSDLVGGHGTVDISISRSLSFSGRCLFASARLTFGLAHMRVGVVLLCKQT